ncbi:hypothetical protein ACXZ1M_18410 [Duganella sp. PWIR1]
MTSLEPVTTMQLVMIAGAGGFVLDMMNLWEDSKKPKTDRTQKNFAFWAFFIFWPLAGAGLAWLYIVDGSTLRPLLAFSIGLSAPTTLQAMISKSATVPSPQPKSMSE